jgi:uncharacterized protein (DUF362 family)
MENGRRHADVALVKGDDRYRNIARALDLIAGQIDVRGKKRILIKPNFVVTNVPLAMTHVDAVRAVLDFLRSRTDALITIGEGSAVGDTLDGFRRLGYTDLAKDYNVELVDLNRGGWIDTPVYDTSFKDMPLRMSRLVVESDLRISVGPPKTHESVFITLSLKNMVMGGLIRDQRERGGSGPVMHVMGTLNRLMPVAIKNGPVLAPLRKAVVQRVMRSDKNAMHMGFPLINLNLCRLAPLVYPHLAVIDGFVGMEGDGPTRGDPVDLRCAVASSDFLAADTVGAALMGYNVDEVGYLHYCKIKGLGAADLADITVLGNTIAECRHPFRPHPSTAQRDWRIAQVERFL